MLRPAVTILCLVLVTLTLPTQAVGEIVSTTEALALEEDHQARQIVENYLSRQDVQSQLIALGVDPELARTRAAALSGEELRQLAYEIENEPAGGDGVLAILGVIFLVLLVLELVGVIDIFKKA